MDQNADTQEYLLASSEAMLAGTLALMTGQAQASCHRTRWLMTRRICANLSELSCHPGLNPSFRAAVRQLNEHWCRLEAELSGQSKEWSRPIDQWIAPSPMLQ